MCVLTATYQLLTNQTCNTIALAGAFFAEMNTLGMPPMGNHASSQLMPEKKMTPPDSKNPAANFASAFKNKVENLYSKYALKLNCICKKYR